MAKKKLDTQSTTGGVIMLVVGILVLSFPDLLRYTLGIALIVLGILALTKNK